MMIKAITRGDLDYVKRHWHNQPFDYDPLVVAVDVRQHAIMKWLLIDAKVKIDAPLNGNLRTAIDAALSMGDVDALHFLLRAGADASRFQYLRHDDWPERAVALLVAYGARLPMRPSPRMRSIWDRVHAKRNDCRQRALIVLFLMRPRDVARDVARFVWNERLNV